MKKERYLECGKIINTHGFRGDVKIESWCDSPEVLAGLKRIFLKRGDSFQEVRVLHTSVFRRFVLAGLDGVATEDEALKLKETVIYADREDIHLAPDAYFLVDLIGLPVYDWDSGVCYGHIREVVNRGASDLYVIQMENGKETMVPAVPEFVKKVDTESGIYLTPIKGMFDDDGETI